MIKFLKSIKARLEAVRRPPKPVDLDRWKAAMNSSEPHRVSFFSLDCITFDTLELVLDSASVNLYANEDNPGFKELVDLCGATWPSFWDDYLTLTSKAFAQESFEYHGPLEAPRILVAGDTNPEPPPENSEISPSN